MHEIILITAMATTTGLFGGGKHCGKPNRGCHKASAASYAPASPCGATYAAPYATPVPSMQAFPTSPQAFPGAPMSPGKTVPAAPPVPAPTSAFTVPGSSLPIVSASSSR